MEWIILFCVSWGLFILLSGWRDLKITIWSGLVAVILQLLVDTNAISHNFYKINTPVIKLWGSSVLFILGPVLIIGILMGQYHPKKRYLRIANVFVLSTLYSSQEFLLLIRKSLEYTNWSFIDSVIVNIAAMIIISWFSIIVLDGNSDAGT